MSEDRLLSIHEAAAELGLHRITVGRRVKELGIKPARLPYSPSGKGLSRQDIDRIRESQPKRRRKATA